MKVIAVKQFTDKQGRTRQVNDSFEAPDAEAQEYIKDGKAKQDTGQQSGQK